MFYFRNLLFVLMVRIYYTHHDLITYVLIVLFDPMFLYMIQLLMCSLGDFKSTLVYSRAAKTFRIWRSKFNTRYYCKILLISSNCNVNCQRSIFQTFWKQDCCAKSLFMELGTLNFYHRHGFDQGFQFWTQIGPAQWLNGTW